MRTSTIHGRTIDCQIGREVKVPDGPSSDDHHRRSSYTNVTDAQLGLARAERVDDLSVSIAHGFTTHTNHPSFPL